MAVRYANNDWDSNPRPRQSDWVQNPSRPRATRSNPHPYIIGEFCAPSDCEHPVSARVWPDRGYFTAKCHDCGMLTTGKDWLLVR